MESLLPFFRWCDETFIAVAVRKSVIAFPTIETFHLLALTLLFGNIAIQNLRLCGLIMKEQPVSRVGQGFCALDLLGAHGNALLREHFCSFQRP